MKRLREANVDATWNKRLLEVVGDVYCMLERIVQRGYLNWDDIIDRSNVKKQKLSKWSNLIKETKW